MRATTDSSWRVDVEKAGVPVIVAFSAVWCGPCKKLAPLLDDIADMNLGKVSVVKVDIDESPRLAARYSVTSVPTVSVFMNGAMVKTFTGGKPKGMLLRELEEWLG